MPRKVDIKDPAVQFSTIKIKVPDHMVRITSKGHLSINVPSLTKAGNPSKRGTEKSIVLEAAKVLKPEIESAGTILIPDEAKSLAKTIRKSAPKITRAQNLKEHIKKSPVEEPPETQKKDQPEEKNQEEAYTIYKRTRSRTKN